MEYYIRRHGFSKASFCRKTGISLAELDRILDEDTGGLDVSDQQMRQIVSALDIDLDALASPPFDEKQRSIVSLPGVLRQSQMNGKEQKEYDLLQDILNLCSIYY